MSSDRRSKRLLGEPPFAEQITKRPRKPNTHTLAAFSSEQPPIRRGKRSKRSTSKPPEPTPAPIKKGKVPETPNIIPPNELHSSSLLRSSPPISIQSSSPVPLRQKRGPSPFDPSREGKLPHYVSILVTPVMDGKRKTDNVIPHSIDINNVDRADLDDLHANVYATYVKGWEYRRKCKPHEKARLSHWTVVIGNPNGVHHAIRVVDDKSWANLLTLLRQMEKDGDRDRKNCHKLFVDAVYESFDREKTPPETKIKTNKAKAKTARPTRLDSSFAEADLSPNDMDDELEDNDDLDAPLPTRNSVTKQQLQRKASNVAALKPTEYTRQQIFAKHRCPDDNCNNSQGACYILKSRQSHHKVSPKEQTEWAEAIGGDPEVTLSTPPAAWIAAYMEGYAEQGKRRRTVKKEKEDTPTQAIVPVADPIPTNIVQHHYHGVQAPVPAPAQPAPQYTQYYDPAPSNYAPPPRPQFAPQPLRRQPPPRPPIPSSPIQEPTSDVLAQFEEWLLESEVVDKQRDLITNTIRIIREEGFDLEQLKSTAAMAILSQKGVRGGTAIFIQDQLSEFRKMWKGRRDAAQGLLKVRSSVTPWYQHEFGGLERGDWWQGGGEGSAGYFDNY